MPAYLSKSPSGTGYLFRRGVPADIQKTIGKREFKQALGGDFQSASQRCRELAVETDRQIRAARAALLGETPQRASLAIAAGQDEPGLVSIKTISPDLLERLRTSVVEQVLHADRAQRRHAGAAINPAAKIEEIERVRAWANLAWLGEETAIYGWSDMLSGTLRRNGLQLDSQLRGSPQERDLLVEYAAAYREALDTLKATYAGNPAHIGAPASGRDRKALDNTPALSSMSLASAVQDFLTHLPPAKRSMNEKHSFILPALVEVVGDVPIGELRQSHIKEFLLTVQKLPPRWTDIRRKEGKTIREIAAQEWEKTISLATYDGSYRASLHAFLARSVLEWQDIGFPTTLSTLVPYFGTRTKAVQKQRSLTQEEIKTIFFNDEMNKIAQSPIKVYKCTNGIWWLRFTTAEGETPDSDVYKSLKTSKPRTVPIHAELVKAGIIEFLTSLKDNGDTRLFPQWNATDGDAGAAPSKWVSSYMRRRGIHGVANELGNAVRGSHTFRHTLLTHGRKNDVNLRCISGHKESTDNPVADGYEDETLLLPLSEMAARLAKLDYGVPLPRPVAVKLPASERK